MTRLQYIIWFTNMAARGSKSTHTKAVIGVAALQ